MKITILTLFPEALKSYCSSSLLGKAQEKNSICFDFLDLKDYAKGNKKKIVDDSPYGGGAGMLLKPEPLFDAVDAIRERDEIPLTTVLMTPQGRLLNTSLIQEFVDKKHLLLICGHYEGVDERVRDHLVDYEISIGDYVLMGGELPAIVFSEAIARYLPNVLGNKESHLDDSLNNGLLEYPQYTRPSELRNQYHVPSVLLSGNHQKIALWRRRESLKKTFLRRPELLDSVNMSPEEKSYVGKLKSNAEEVR